MKALFWKIQYMRHFRRRLKMSMREAFNVAGSALENLNGDTDECPIFAAESDYGYWLQD